MKRISTVAILFLALGGSAFAQGQAPAKPALAGDGTCPCAGKAGDKACPGAGQMAGKACPCAGKMVAGKGCPCAGQMGAGGGCPCGMGGQGMGCPCGVMAAHLGNVRVENTKDGAIIHLTAKEPSDVTAVQQAANQAAACWSHKTAASAPAKPQK